MTDEWYYASEGQRLGPVNFGRLRELVARGEVGPSELLWTEGMANWVPAREVSELFAEPDWVPRSQPQSPPPTAPLSSGPSYLSSGLPLPPVGSGYGGGALAFGQGGGVSASSVLPPAQRWDEEPGGGAIRRNNNGGNRLKAGLTMAAAVIAVTAAAYFLGQGLSLLGEGGGVEKGPRSFHLRSGGDREFFIEFPADKECHIWITSKEDSDVDLWVYDSRGNMVTSDTRFDKDCHVTFTPAATEQFKVVVANRVLVGGKGINRRNRSNYVTMKTFPE